MQKLKNAQESVHQTIERLNLTNSIDPQQRDKQSSGLNSAMRSYTDSIDNLINPLKNPKFSYKSIYQDKTSRQINDYPLQKSIISQGVDIQNLHPQSDERNRFKTERKSSFYESPRKNEKTQQSRKQQLIREEDHLEQSQQKYSEARINSNSPDQKSVPFYPNENLIFGDLKYAKNLVTTKQTIINNKPLKLLAEQNASGKIKIEEKEEDFGKLQIKSPPLMTINIVGLNSFQSQNSNSAIPLSPLQSKIINIGSGIQSQKSLGQLKFIRKSITITQRPSNLQDNNVDSQINGQILFQNFDKMRPQTVSPIQKRPKSQILKGISESKGSRTRINGNQSFLYEIQHNQKQDRLSTINLELKKDNLQSFNNKKIILNATIDQGKLILIKQDDQPVINHQTKTPHLIGRRNILNIQTNHQVKHRNSIEQRDSFDVNSQSVKIGPKYKYNSKNSLQIQNDDQNQQIALGETKSKLSQIQLITIDEEQNTKDQQLSILYKGHNRSKTDDKNLLKDKEIILQNIVSPLEIKDYVSIELKKKYQSQQKSQTNKNKQDLTLKSFNPNKTFNFGNNQGQSNLGVGYSQNNSIYRTFNHKKTFQENLEEIVKNLNYQAFHSQNNHHMIYSGSRFADKIYRHRDANINNQSIDQSEEQSIISKNKQKYHDRKIMIDTQTSLKLNEEDENKPLVYHLNKAKSAQSKKRRALAHNNTFTPAKGLELQVVQMKVQKYNEVTNNYQDQQFLASNIQNYFKTRSNNIEMRNIKQLKSKQVDILKANQPFFNQKDYLNNNLFQSPIAHVIEERLRTQQVGKRTSMTIDNINQYNNQSFATQANQSFNNQGVSNQQKSQGKTNNNLSRIILSNDTSKGHINVVGTTKPQFSKHASPKVNSQKPTTPLGIPGFKRPPAEQKAGQCSSSVGSTTHKGQRYNSMGQAPNSNKNQNNFNKDLDMIYNENLDALKLVEEPSSTNQSNQNDSPSNKRKRSSVLFKHQGRDFTSFKKQQEAILSNGSSYLVEEQKQMLIDE